MDRDVEYRIADLELRLVAYHEHLSEVIQQRDRLAIDAAWGVHGSLHSIIAYAAVLGVAYKLGATGWWWALAGFVAWAASTAALMHSNAARMKEVDTFLDLPDWKPVL